MQGIRLAVIVVWTIGTMQAQNEGMPPRPPRAMLEACEAKAEGAACQAQTPSGETATGECRRGPRGETPLACVPNGGPGVAAAPAIPGTQVSTAGVLCGYAVNKINPDVQLPSSARWSCSGNERTLTANGVPDHPVGAFPNAGNPNRIAAQNVRFSVTLTPALRQGQPVRVRIAGYALNGIKFDPGTAQTCTENCGNHGADPSGRWRIEALQQSYFDFGVDQNNAHVQPDGSYHYHGVPSGLLQAAGVGGQKAMLVGWAVDGFPMYARLDGGGAKSSYRLKSAPDPGRPATGIAPMGTFTQDYEYAAGSGDLDECNGRSGATPEFPKGTYYYMLTASYPFVPRCVKGNPTATGPGYGGPPPGLRSKR